MFELAAAGLPAILVPYPHATADHQTGNARWMADAGAAVVVPDAEVDADRLAREVGRCSTSPAAWSRWRPRARGPGPAPTPPTTSPRACLGSHATREIG